jgi:carbamoyltransferase
MIILGVNAHHADASAAIIADGKLVAAAEEERFRRIKHWAGLPTEAIRYCLLEAGVAVNDVDAIAVNRDPNARLWQRLRFLLTRRPSLGAIRRRLENRARIRDIRGELLEALGLVSLRPPLRHVEHHRAHLASAFFVAPFEEAAVLSLDGFGDFVSAMWGVARGNHIEVLGEIGFPHSLGIFYTALTQYLGFPQYGDEYKVMGLAPYGRAVMLDAMRDIVHVQDGRFELNLEYFTHHSAGLEMMWPEGTPVIGPIYSPRLVQKLGPARAPQDPIEQRHKDVAASMQAMFEDAYFALADNLFTRTRVPRLCLAGGCGYNSVANGLVLERSPFRDFYVQSAAGDAGGAIGAAYWLWNQEGGNARSFVMDHAYWGPQYAADAIERAVRDRQEDLDQSGCVSERAASEGDLCARVARSIADGQVVGWFQGRMEWGPRALGNRSILAHPGLPNMKDVLNARIKRREWFRPFAPSILQERQAEFFEYDHPSPFMLHVYKIKPQRREQLCAVNHVDDTGRLQSVSRDENPLYYDLIKSFERKTGFPVILNTSFNENEPIVCAPEEAISCFQRTKMDMLAIGPYVAVKREN